MLSKESALQFVKKMTPLYSGVFQELRAEGGRVKIASRYAKHRQDLGAYVLLYDDERKPGVAMMLAFLGEEGFKKFNEDAASWSSNEISAFIEEIGSDEAQDALLEGITFPVTEEEWIEADKRYLALPEDKKAAALKTSAFLFSGVFAQIFNTLALMTHGAALTTLVPQAIAGDDEAFLKSVQVDRCLLTHHPYFVSRKQKAQDEGEKEFLSALAYRESNPNLKGKIRYPALFMLFGLLDLLKWLDKLKHDEILDLCDEIGLDRFQNRIEDVNYLTKRLADYRRFQKSGVLSMQ
jgi:hypothetical protein